MHFNILKKSNIINLTVIMSFFAAVIFISGCGDERSAMEIRNDNIEYDHQQHKMADVEFTGELTLDQIIAFSLQHNLQKKVREMEVEIEKEMITQAWLKSLPDLTGNFDFNKRSNTKASRSVDLETGSISLSRSRSSETNSKKANLNASWDIVEFSSNFLMALQAKDRHKIAEIKVRRLKQDLIYDIRKAYWNCVIMGEAARQADDILKDVELRSERLRRRIKDNTLPKRDGLKLQKELTLIKMRLKGYRTEWEKAKSELKLKMGISPDTEIKLAPIEIPFMADFEKFDIGALEHEALVSRPELYQQDKEKSISRNGVRLAIASFIPSIPINLRHDYDNNPYLYANNWYNLGIKSSYSILEIPQKIASLRAAKLRDKLVEDRRMALSMGILAQVNLALIQYHEMADICLTNSAVAKVQDELVKISKSQLEQGKKTQSEYMSARMDAFFSNFDYMAAYARLMGHLAQIENSVGRDIKILPQSLPVKMAGNFSGEKK